MPEDMKKFDPPSYALVKSTKEKFGFKNPEDCLWVNVGPMQMPADVRPPTYYVPCPCQNNTEWCADKEDQVISPMVMEVTLIREQWTGKPEETGEYFIGQCSKCRRVYWARIVIIIR